MVNDSRAGEELARVIATQHRDGSWGTPETASRRILPTIFTARSLQESGVEAGAALDRALDFLEATAVVDGGASTDGSHDSVLSCYTGMLARLLVCAGRFEAAPTTPRVDRALPARGLRRHRLPPARPARVG